MFFSPQYKSEWEEREFREQKVKKKWFSKNKKLWKIDDIDVNKILPCSANKSIKYFSRYTDNDFIRPLCITLPQMTVYVSCFDSNKTISFKVSDEKLLKRYIKIWENLVA